MRQQLAAAIRMLERAGIIDFNGHGSVRTGTDRFFINSGRSIRSHLTAEDIVEVDLDGHLLEGAADPPLEYPLHAEIYRRRGDATAILHAHPKWSTLLTTTGHSYEPVFAQGSLLGSIPVFPEVLSINSASKGAALAEILGEGRAALLQSHGSVVVSADLVECFALAVYLEENASRQYLALQIGTPRIFSADEIAVCRDNLWKPNLFQKTWDYYAAKADVADRM
jgi:L-fuculose-phosphate aldolase